MPTPSAIYLPRATFADRVGDAEEGKAEIIARMESTAIATPARPDLTEFFMLSLQADAFYTGGLRFTVFPILMKARTTDGTEEHRGINA
jgi:hypothetical protein